MTTSSRNIYVHRKKFLLVFETDIIDMLKQEKIANNIKPNVYDFQQQASSKKDS